MSCWPYAHCLWMSRLRHLLLGRDLFLMCLLFCQVYGCSPAAGSLCGAHWVIWLELLLLDNGFFFLLSLAMFVWFYVTLMSWWTCQYLLISKIRISHAIGKKRLLLSVSFSFIGLCCTKAYAARKNTCPHKVPFLLQWRFSLWPWEKSSRFQAQIDIIIRDFLPYIFEVKNKKRIE